MGPTMEPGRSGVKQRTTASPTGGFEEIATKSMTRMMTPPRICATLSTAALPLFERKMQIASEPPRIAPIFSWRPNIASKPSATPPTLPMLKARPPRTTRKVKNTPRPGSTVFAISCPRLPETPITDQILVCATASMMMTQRITKANEARYFAVNWEVWVKKPGPMAEVAIRKAAPSFTERLWLFWLLFILLPL